MLVTHVLDPTVTTLPSPNQLKRRILIKHKKLMVDGEVVPERAQQPIVPNPSEADFASFMSDLSNSTKNGYLFMQDPIDKVRGMPGVVVVGGREGQGRLEKSVLYSSSTGTLFC
jgi:hypothetical protein